MSWADDACVLYSEAYLEPWNETLDADRVDGCYSFSDASVGCAARGNSTVSYANTDYPITVFSLVYPTGRVGLESDSAALRKMRTTIWAVNERNRWRPLNGLCLAWPAAARVTDKHDPYPYFAARIFL